MNDTAIVDFIEKHVTEIWCPLQGGVMIVWTRGGKSEMTNGSDLRDAVRKANGETAVKEEVESTKEPVFCRNCGCGLEPDEVDSEINGHPSGICSGCRRVTNDYYWIDDFDEFDEDDEYGRTHTCETCGGEYGDGWSTCTCEEE